MEKVTVLMSTYNGEQYICEQLDSILQQENVQVEVVIRDDCSTDSTFSILQKYAETNQNIRLLKGTENLGACGSFLELISGEYDSDFFALSDQDDVWDKDKLYIAVHKLQGLDLSKPALYYSNLRIVDEKLNFIRESHVKPLVPGARYSFLSDVFVTGCTAVFNRALQQIAFEIKPKDFSMHDTWLYCVASMFGSCVYDFDSHISYRQHNDNVIGTRRKRISMESIVREAKSYLNWSDQPRLKCARLLLAQFDSRIDDATRNKLKEFVHYKDTPASTLKLALDNELNSEDVYRRIRFKINVLLRNA